MSLLAQIMCSGLIILFTICYHAGGSTKHLRWPKVKRRDEESSPSDALTPKKRKTRLAGKMRTNLWACPITPTLQTHLTSPCLCKIKIGESSKMAWIDAIRTTRYPLILMLCCDVFMFIVQARISQRRKFRVALPKLFILWKRVFFKIFLLDCKLKSVYMTMTISLTVWKKKNKKSSVRVCRRAFFV